MIRDKGKFILTLIVTTGLLIIIGVLACTGQEVPGFIVAAFSSAITYVYVNGKQLVAPFTPSPMIVPKPDAARRLIEAEAADRGDQS